MIRVVLFVFLIFLPGITRAQINYDRVPHEWHDYLKHEFMNIAVRSDEIIPESDQKIIKIHHIEVLENKAESFRSSFLDGNSTKYAYVERNGKKYVRFFFDKSELNKIQLSIMKAQKLKIKQEFLGVRLQGHSSYFVWKPDDSTYRPVILKLQMKGYNHQGILCNGVKVNDFIEKTLSESSNRSIGYLPERFTSTVFRKIPADGGYSYLIRDLASPHVIKGGNIKFIPLHGLLSKGEFLKKLAEKKKMTVDRWIQSIYIPKLAEFSATINLDHGFYVEGHTQNLIAFVDEKTGDLLSIGFRDLSDVMVDPHLRMSQGKSLNYNYKNKIWSRVNESFIDVQIAKKPGYNLGIYTGQSVSDLYDDQRKNAKLAVEFMEEYKKLAEKKLNRKITISSEAQKYFSELKDYANGSKKIIPDVPLDKLRWGEIRYIMSEVQQDIYEQFIKNTIPVISKDSFSYKQRILKNIYKNQNRHGLVTYFNVEGVEKSNPKFIFNKVRFGFDGKGVFTYHPKTKKILSYAHKLTEKNIEVIRNNKLNISARGSYKCFSGILQNLFR